MASDIDTWAIFLNLKRIIKTNPCYLAARNVDLRAVNMLLDHGAPVELRGTDYCNGRIPLAELCCAADLSQNPLQLRRRLELLCDASASFTTTAEGKTLISYSS